MAVAIPSAADFEERFPHFRGASLSLVNASLAQAARRTNEFVYTDSTTEIDAVCLKAAVLLSAHPEARKMQWVDKEQVQVWKRELFELQRSATMGLRTFF